MKIKFLLLLTISSFIFNGCGQKKDNKAVSRPVKHFPLSTGDYTVNTGESKLFWTGKEVSTKKHYGTINIKKVVILAGISILRVILQMFIF